MTTNTKPGVKGGIGTSVLRPDGEPKVTGRFEYASDLVSEDMLWGATVRSPYAHARLVNQHRAILRPEHQRLCIVATAHQNDRISCASLDRTGPNTPR